MMASPAAKRKRSLEDELASTESEFGNEKRSLIAELDVAKANKSSKNYAIRSQALSRYDGLLIVLQTRNKAFEEKALDLKSQIYDIEAAEVQRHVEETRRSETQILRSTQPASTQIGVVTSRPGLESKATTSIHREQAEAAARSTLNPAAQPSVTPAPKRPQQLDPVFIGNYGMRSKPGRSNRDQRRLAEQMQKIRKDLKRDCPAGFSFLPSFPLLVKESAQEGKTRDRWVQIHCAACTSTTKGNGEYFDGLKSLSAHIRITGCHRIPEELDLDQWAYILLYCMQDITEAYVADVVARKIKLPQIRHASPMESSEAELQQEAINAALQRKNSFYRKPPPRKFVNIIDLTGDDEPSVQQTSSSVDQHGVNEPHDKRHHSAPLTAGLGSSACESIVRATTEALVDATGTNEVTSQPRWTAINR